MIEKVNCMYMKIIYYYSINLNKKSSVYDRLHPSQNKYNKIPFKYNLNFTSNNFLEELLKKINTL